MAELFDMRTLGLATLICIGAIAVGYVIARIWPKRHNPQLFATLIAIALVGALAYAGVTAAGLALVVLILAALAFGAMAIGFG